VTGVSLRSRITLFGLAVVVAVLVGFSAAIYGLIAAGLSRTQDRDLTTRLTEAVKQIETAPASAFAARPALTPVLPASHDEIFVVVTDRTGAVLATTGGQRPQLPPSLLSTAARTGTAVGTVTMDGVPVRVQVRPWRRTDLAGDGFVAAAQAVHRQVADIHGIVAALIISAVVTLAAAALAIWLVTRRALRPLRELTATADEIRRSVDRGRRLPPVPRSDELGQLTASFNGMLDRLEAEHRATLSALEAQQRLAADASHELRTPLTTIRSNAAFLREHHDAASHDRAAALADLEAEAVRMSRLVDDLLILARADGGAPLALAPVDLGRLATDVCSRAGAAHADRRVHCSAPPVCIRGDHDLLERLLWILLDNAARHTAFGGNIWVVLASPTPDVAIIQVADDGEGIPPGDEDRIFDRFYQADPARRHGGAGLGLAIARWITRAHDGSLTAGPTQGGGATFTAVLRSVPLEPPGLERS
jgi:two-component system, OmpR family, sensor kinase